MMSIGNLMFSGTMLLTWILVVFASCLVPFFSRKNTAFGVSIPESEYHTQFLSNLRHRYFMVSLICGIVLGVGSLLTQFWFSLNTSVWIQTVLIFAYLAITTGIYLKCYFEVGKYKQTSNWETTQTVAAALTVDINEKKPINPLWFLSYLAIIVCSISVGIIRYPSLPAQIRMHYNIAGQVDRYATKSISNLLMMPLTQVLMALIFFVIYYAILKAKNQSGGGDIEEGLKKDRAFKAIMSKFLFLMGLAVMILFSIIQLSTLGLVGVSVTIAAPIVLLVVIFAAIAYLVVKVGQGGSRLGGSKGINSKVVAEDDNHWILGLIYYNKDDPSIFVEKRFGMGYTVNFGSLVGKIIIVALIIVIAGSLVLPHILH
ncbi:DUF5808 domain-containing protein [Desulfosporosinus sp. Sb-LF]|uniref:DUF1648 domain-containing protein n=1 Tax=Desulfosporosinus sp. Sb-LF TaxID=2560027 RepID=UPI00107EF269|nr:DUF5808 domain-containing protein [Desulfosporosinus sp. Sb-LF]TGE31081.1 DUF1648 domain-containing protein [Desulfosporosinus sp. Sb-LF]